MAASTCQVVVIMTAAQLNAPFPFTSCNHVVLPRTCNAKAYAKERVHAIFISNTTFSTTILRFVQKLSTT